ncbi:hypothetical protein EV361DRAFT_387820 [Lentinula raphanica]|nr:hypothetical protein EV361DRAFT_387820 [Lentinula raphanica]
MLFNEPDFVNIPSLLEQAAKRHDYGLLFLPKFHCELNFIEMCWGRAKLKYRTCEPSKKEEVLERNMVWALDSIDLPMMRRFARRSRRIMDAYHKGLDGKWAAWAAKKYHGHRVLPESLMKDMEEAKAQNEMQQGTV